MTTENDDGNYTGLHAFVFINRVDAGRNIADVIDDIGGPGGAELPNGRVLFASVFVGSYIGFAHVRTGDGDLAALQRLIYHDLGAKGVHCEHAVEGPVYTPMGVNALPKGPKRRSPPFCALVRSEPTTTRPRSCTRSPAGSRTATRSRAHRSSSGRPTF